MSRPDAVDFAFAGLVILISVAPILTLQGWQGYGPGGEFSCNCGPFYVRFSDPAYGGDKPHVFAAYQGFQVDILEFSDYQSTVNGLNLHQNFTTRPSLSGQGLTVNYVSHALNFTKRIIIDGDVVNVDYTFDRGVTADFTFWRWYFTSIGPFDRPITRVVQDPGSLNFSVFGQGALFNASLNSNPPPVSARISGIEGAGLNKISLQFTGRSVDLSVVLRGIKPVAGAGVVEVASSNAAFPVIGVCMAAVYVGARKWAVRK